MEEIVVIGAECVGKSVFIKALKNIIKSVDSQEINASPADYEYAAPTVGVDIVDLNINGKLVTIRELGAAISSRWSSYYANSKAFIFIIDVCDISLWSTSALLLHEFLSYESLTAGKKILLFLNKADLCSATMIETAKQHLHINHIDINGRDIRVLEGSSFAIDCLDQIRAWIVE
jgi:GTPase SAR1 family protein